VEFIEASKVYQTGGDAVFAVRGVNLALAEGSFTAVVGRSGCGKSTLLSLAGAVDVPTSGDVRFENVSTRQLSDAELSRLRRTQIGFVFQFFHLLPTLTAMENVALPLLLDHVRMTPEVEQRIIALLADFDLAEKARHFPHQLSGGEMQRVAIARALAPDPRLIIADEPTGNLDSTNGAHILRWLRRISSDMGRTILMATHSREAASAASAVIEMRDGRLLQAAG
jgi:ABC-type lipoprotein export system ATPase subunit